MYGLATLETRDHLPVAARADARFELLDYLWDPEPAVPRHGLEDVRLELVGGNADNRVGLAIQGNRASNDRGIGAEVRPPHTRAENDDVVVPLLVLVGIEEAPGQRPQAEDVEEAFRHLEGPKHFRPIAARVVVTVWLRSGNLREAGRLRAPVDEIPWCDLQLFTRRRVLFPQRDNAVRIGIGKWPQQHL